jgi:hypothetical protein
VCCGFSSIRLSACETSDELSEKRRPGSLTRPSS